MMRKAIPVGMALVIGMQSAGDVRAQTEPAGASRPSFSERFSRWTHKLVGGKQTEGDAEAADAPAAGAPGTGTSAPSGGAVPAGATPPAYPNNPYAAPGPVYGANNMPNAGQPGVRGSALAGRPAETPPSYSPPQTQQALPASPFPYQQPSARVSTPAAPTANPAMAGNPFTGRPTNSNASVDDRYPLVGVAPQTNNPYGAAAQSPTQSPAVQTTVRPTTPVAQSPVNPAPAQSTFRPQTPAVQPQSPATQISARPPGQTPTNTSTPAQSAPTQTVQQTAAQSSPPPAAQTRVSPPVVQASANPETVRPATPAAQASVQAVQAGVPGSAAVSASSAMRSRFHPEASGSAAGGSAPAAAAPASAAQTAVRQLKDEYPSTNAPGFRTASAPAAASTTTPATPAAPSAQSRASESAQFDARAAVEAVHRRNLDDNVLLNSLSPILVVETSGPRAVTIGKEAVYKVTIRNLGNVNAKDVAVVVRVPLWAEVVHVESKSQGPRPTNHSDGVRWNLKQLDGKQSEELNLKIVPRQGTPFDLAVQITHSPVASHASVEVREPKLEMTLSGPNEVLFGKQEIYKLILINPGTGDCENVELRLLPTVPGETPTPGHKLGLLKAGEEKVIELELTARQTGVLRINAEVSASGNLKDAVDESIVVRRAGLHAVLVAPRLRYSGTMGNYEIQLTNTGNAPAKNINVVCNVPEGMRFASANLNGRYDAVTGQVVWRIEELPAAAQRSLMWHAEVGAEGQTHLKVTCAADTGLSESCEFTQMVESVADLTMHVSDPRGPLPVGEEMIYEVVVANRGTKAAENVLLTTLFAEGLEPLGVEGDVPADVHNGRLLFQPIVSLEPGQRKSVRVKARATAGGNHLFRAELICETLDARIAKEENTRFYGDSPADVTAGAPAGATRR